MKKINIQTIIKVFFYLAIWTIAIIGECYFYK